MPLLDFDRIGLVAIGLPYILSHFLAWRPGLKSFSLWKTIRLWLSHSGKQLRNRSKLMSHWIRVVRVEDCPPGKATEVIAGEQVVALYNVDGQFYALDGVCPLIEP